MKLRLLDGLTVRGELGATPVRFYFQGAVDSRLTIKLAKPKFRDRPISTSNGWSRTKTASTNRKEMKLDQPVPVRPRGKPKFFCSWSGGKDSALALHRAQSLIGTPTALLTMMIEDGFRSRSHGLRADVLRAQAQALGLPLRLISTSWADYEARFDRALVRLHAGGNRLAVYGDIDNPDHQRWVHEASARQGMAAVLPLWGADRSGLLKEFLNLGFRARIIAIKDGVLPRSLLGRELGPETMEGIARSGVDLSGENGEYHTVVHDGPVFSRPLRLVNGKVVKRDGYWFQDVLVQHDL